MGATATRNGSASTLRITEGCTYKRSDNDGPNFFRDLWLSYADQSADATARLRRNAAEVRAYGLKTRSATQPEGTRFEFRAPEGDVPTVNPDNSITPGAGGSFTPPLWLVQDEAIVPRPERVLSDLIGSLALPMGVSSVNVPG